MAAAKELPNTSAQCSTACFAASRCSLWASKDRTRPTLPCFFLRAARTSRGTRCPSHCPTALPAFCPFYTIPSLLFLHQLCRHSFCCLFLLHACWGMKWCVTSVDPCCVLQLWFLLILPTLPFLCLSYRHPSEVTSMYILHCLQAVADKAWDQHSYEAQIFRAALCSHAVVLLDLPICHVQLAHLVNKLLSCSLYLILPGPEGEANPTILQSWYPTGRPWTL